MDRRVMRGLHLMLRCVGGLPLHSGRTTTLSVRPYGRQILDWDQLVTSSTCRRNPFSWYAAGHVHGPVGNIMGGIGGGEGFKGREWVGANLSTGGHEDS